MRSVALSRFAKSLGIGHTPRMDAHSFTKEDIESVRGALSELVTLPESISITGIPAHEFRLLQQAGLIKAHHVGTYFGDKGARFMRSDVITLVELACAAAGSDDGDALNLYRFARRSGYRVGEVLAMVVQGEMVPCRLDPEATGFRKLMFKWDSKVVSPNSVIELV